MSKATYKRFGYRCFEAIIRAKIALEFAQLVGQKKLRNFGYKDMADWIGVSKPYARQIVDMVIKWGMIKEVTEVDHERTKRLFTITQKGIDFDADEIDRYMGVVEHD